MNLFNKIKEIIKNQVVITTTVLYLISGTVLYNIVPMQIKQNSYNEAKNEATAIISVIKESREYCFEKLNNKVRDSICESSVNGVTKIIKDQNIKINIYNSFNKINSNHSETIDFLELNPGSILSKIIVKDNKEYIVVSSEDYTMQKYFKVKNKNNVGITSVIEVTIPISTLVRGNTYNVQNNILYFITLIFVVSVVFYIMNLLQIQKVMENKNESINSEILSSFKELNFENKELENSLREMRTIFNKHIIFSKTDLFGVITEVSDAFCEISGYSEEELIGQPHSIVRHPDMPVSSFKGMWGTIENNKVWTGNVKNLKKDKDYYWVHAVVAPNYDQEGAKIGYISIRNLITDKKIIENLNKSLLD